MWLTFLLDRPAATGDKKRSSVLDILSRSLNRLFADSTPMAAEGQSRYRYIDWATRHTLRTRRNDEVVCVLNAKDFPPRETCATRV